MRRTSFSFLSLVLLVMAIGFLDPGCRRQEQKTPPTEPGLAEILIKILADQGLAANDIHQFQDNAGRLHCKVELELDKYEAIEPELETQLTKASGVILKKEKNEVKDAVYFLWQVAGKSQEQVTILFACRPKRPPSSPLSRKMAAIIVDDLGYSLEAVQNLCALKKPITVSILPFVPLTQETAELAHEGGLEIMLHLPLESLKHPAMKTLLGGTISEGMNREEIKRDVEACLQQIPWCKGVNNHAGSKITEDLEIMRSILEVIKDKGLYFIDSRTTKNSVAFDLALKLGVPSAMRKVFIDAVGSDEGIRAKLAELFQMAREKGQAVGICHARPETLRALQKNIGLADGYGVELVFASGVVATRRGS
jgi:polysaccharide deacetylase 2 family uncharacterized protein YibQ